MATWHHATIRHQVANSGPSGRYATDFEAWPCWVDLENPHWHCKVLFMPSPHLKDSETTKIYHDLPSIYDFHVVCMHPQHGSSESLKGYNSVPFYDKELRLLGKGGFGTVTKARVWASFADDPRSFAKSWRKVSAFGTIGIFWNQFARWDDQGFSRQAIPVILCPAR